MKSIILQQLRVLLWKNFRLRKRKPISLILEILVPLIIIFILVAVRRVNLKFRMEQCEFKEKRMSSMGLVPFLMDFLCTFNTTCYNKTQIDWNGNYVNDFEILLYNISSIYNSLPDEELTVASLFKWSSYHSYEVGQLKNSINYISTKLSPLFVALNQSFENSSHSEPIYFRLYTLLCGSKENDFSIFYEKINNISKSKQLNNTCENKFQKYFGDIDSNPISRLISSWIFGKIYYSPDSPFTREMMKRVNYTTFKVLDDLRLAAVEWRVNFKDWLIKFINNYGLINEIEKCESFFLYLIPGFCDNFRKHFNRQNTQSIIENISVLFSLIENALNCTELNKFVPMKSSIDIDNLANQTMDNLLAGLVIDERFQFITKRNATFLKYQIRMPTDRIDSTKKFKVLDIFWTAAPRRNTLIDFKYYTSGFLLLQEAVDQAFIEMITNNGNYNNISINIGTSMQIMPYPCYVNDKFIRFLSNMIPFLLVIAWVTSVTSLIKSIVYEKENRLKEFMKVMGLENSVHWLGWFLSTFTVLIFPVFIMSFTLIYASILSFSSFSIVFLVIFSYVISIICQTFLLSTFFDKANLASVAGGIIYFVFYMPFIVFIKLRDDLTTIVYYFGGLSTQVAFSNAVNFIGNWEQATEGVHFYNLFDSVILNLNFGVGHCVLMMWIDSGLYLVIGWYVEAVFPGKYGLARPWYFLFTRSYWCPNTRKEGKEENGDDNDDDEEEEIICVDNENDTRRFIDNIDENSSFEAEPIDLRIGISIRNLVKTYPGAKIRAIDNLNLNFYQSQITAFLGHNGAGKTTTISILTGIFSPSSGTAYVLNENIRKGMENIRRKMGLCPQYNILFDNLTVEDHIYFYGLLKGLNNEEIKQSLFKIVEDVGLTNKIHSFSKNLSGGMKRKLSVAMAFIGNSRVVFLDEPTAGVDPFARRGIWDLLVKYRSDDRTIILTTHHMDEADYLSDRIAIISKGRLQCCGSSVFLKRKFGDGYYLTLVKNNETETSSSIGTILEFVKSHITDAKLIEETKTQWTIVLPQNDKNSGRFSQLFADLDKSLIDLNIVSYGLSDTSLEKVFLKVADDPSDDFSEIISENINNIAFDGDIVGQESTLRCNTTAGFGKIEELSSVNRKSIVPLKLLNGLSLLRQQLLGLQIKRFHYSKRNVKGFFTELIFPVLMILLVIILLKSANPLTNQPLMEISPWLMMPKGRLVNLNTFYRKENLTNPIIDELEKAFRSDLGESGVRCMDKSVFELVNYKCFPSNYKNHWSPIPVGNISLKSPECDCNKTGYQLCSDPRSGGPRNSYRIMASSDKLNNLTGYNISDYLMKNFRELNRKLYGGYQFLLVSSFGRSTKAISELPLWNGLRSATNSSKPVKFLDYFQNVFNISGSKTMYARIWINSKGYVSMPAYANVFSNLILRTRLNSSKNPSEFGISVSNYPLKFSKSNLLEELVKQMFLEVSLGIYVIFGLSFIPASFVIFLIEERMSGSKRQQFVSGINPYVYWISNFLWDIIKYVIPVIVVIMIFIAFDYQSYIGNKNIAAFISLLFFYGLAIIPHMYPSSFFFSTPSTAFVVLDSYNLLVGSITTISTFFLDLLQENELFLKPVNDLLKKLFLIFPQFDLGRGMMDLSFNYLKYNITGGKLNYDPFDWNTTGEKLFSLLLLSVVWWGVLILIESGVVNRVLCNKLRNYNSTNKEVINGDADCRLEKERIISNVDNNDVLRVINLTKIYNSLLNRKHKCCKKLTKTFLSQKKNLAVNNLCFGVKEGECFGLLGVNGAGKTTTFKMLTGEENITHGNAFINGCSIINDMIGAHRNMGFCPQFDALHSLLTCEEQLYFYCRIRGIESSQIKSTVELSLKNLSLIPHTEKMAQTLSGGNKRKLSTAIALIGFPKVIFLDEPTSGMDAGARRFLWNIIQKVTNENKIAVILTSHNMEECEALCHRLSIMVNGEMKCLGSVQHLKSKFGDDYFATIRMLPNKCQISEKLKIKSIVENHFSCGVLLASENFITIQYRFDISLSKLSVIFNFFEKLKIDNLIADFSISQTTLDEIFISFAKENDAFHKSDSELSDMTSRAFTRNRFFKAKKSRSLEVYT